MKPIAMIVALVLATLAPTLAGTTGVVSGVVIDEDDRPITNAKVDIISTSDQWSGVTDGHGIFIFLNATPGTYVVVVEHEGYTPTAWANVQVTADHDDFLRVRQAPALRILKRFTHIDYFGFVTPYAAWDTYTVHPDAFEGYPNPVAMMLRSIPGINLGAGGFAP